jgi:hypothetical protein
VRVQQQWRHRVTVDVRRVVAGIDRYWEVTLECPCGVGYSAGMRCLREAVSCRGCGRFKVVMVPVDDQAAVAVCADCWVVEFARELQTIFPHEEVASG